MNNLKPTNLRIILLVINLLIAGATVASYFVGKNYLNEIAGNVKSQNIKAKSSENKIYRMKALAIEMEKIKETRELVSEMVAPQSSFKYQERSISILNDYANQSGVRISNFNFEPSTKPTKNKDGVQKITISVSLTNPVGYSNFLKFMKLVEGGLSQMQITKVDVNQDKEKDRVSVGPLSITIYVK